MGKIFPGLDLKTATPDAVEAAFRIGVKAALRAHKIAGVPAIVWDRINDRIVSLAPEDIPDFPAPTTETNDLRSET